MEGCLWRPYIYSGDGNNTCCMPMGEQNNRNPSTFSRTKLAVEPRKDRIRKLLMGRADLSCSRLMYHYADHLKDQEHRGTLDTALWTAILARM